MRARAALLATIVVFALPSYGGIARASPLALNTLGRVVETPLSVVAGTTANHVYAYSAGRRRVLGTIRIVEPVGWSPAQRTPGLPGRIVLFRGTCRTVRLLAIERRAGSSTRIRIGVDCGAQHSFRVALRRVLAPRVVGRSAWSFALRSEGTSLFRTVPGSSAKTVLPSTNPPPGPPTALEFASGVPSGPVASGAPFTAVVHLVDAKGELSTADDTVTLTTSSACPGTTLTGSTAVAAVHGVATFDALSIPTRCASVALVATAGGLQSASSAAFAVMGRWTEVDTTTPSVDFAAAPLPDGRILVVGGCTGPEFNVAVATTQIFDPVTGSWADAPDAPHARCHGRPTALLDGRIFVAGGFDLSGASKTPLSTADIYDPATASWTSTQMPGSGDRATFAVMTLHDGRVLALNDPAGVPAVYDPSDGNWTEVPGPSIVNAYDDSETVLADGRVLVVGATTGDVASSQLFDPATDSWSAAAGIPTPRTGQGAVRLPDGTVLVVGGTAGGAVASMADIYHPDSDSWTEIPGPPSSDLSRPGAAMLVDGVAMFMQDSESAPGTAAWFYSSSVGWWSAYARYAVLDGFFFPRSDGSVIALSYDAFQRYR